MVVAAGILWVLIGGVYTDLGRGQEAAAAFRHVFLEYAELLLFLIVAMSYVSALEERHVFDVLRARLIRSRLSYRAPIWLNGTLAFFISPISDYLTTALIMGAVVIAVGSGAPRFVALSCINIVVAANAVWQEGLVEPGDLFRLFLPSLMNFVVPAVLMHAAVLAAYRCP